MPGMHVPKPGEGEAAFSLILPAIHLSMQAPHSNMNMYIHTNIHVANNSHCTLTMCRALTVPDTAPALTS